MYRKAPIPSFNKDENLENDAYTFDETKLSKSGYKEKYKPFREDPNFIKMKSNQERAENALKKWKKEKLDHHKRGTSRKAFRKKRNSSTERMSLRAKGPKTNKGLSLYQTGKAIVFQ